MQRIIAFFIFATIKTLSMIFFRAEVKWLTPKPKNLWHDIKLFILLNHTSLYEPLFMQIASYSYIWKFVAHMNVPGADVCFLF